MYVRVCMAPQRYSARVQQAFLIHIALWRAAVSGFGADGQGAMSNGQIIKGDIYAQPLRTSRLGLGTTFRTWRQGPHSPYE